MLAGVHGDEYEAQIALSRLAQDLVPEQLRGRVILLPMTNLPAAQAGLRTSPIDNGNLNRTFPGDPTGTPTAMIADHLENALLPMADYLVDLHSGGTSLYYPPTLLRGRGVSPEEADKLRLLQDAFDLPYAWVFTSGGGQTSAARTAMGAGNRNGVVSIMAELGGGGAVTPDILKMTERGLRRILHVLGMLPGYQPDAARGTRELHAQGSVYAYHSGLFEPLKDIGDTVVQGETIGLVHHPETPLQAPDAIASPYEGIVLCKRALAPIARGDAAFQIARDAEPA
jgi:hypothetical protein